VAGTDGGIWSNNSLGQNFGEDSISLGSAFSVTGMDIYTRQDFATVGNSVTIRIWDDLAGLPSTLLYDFTESISIVDTDGVGPFGADIRRVHADFTSPITLGAGSYWVGMSGTGYELAQTSIVNGTGAGMDGKMAQFSGTTYQFMTNVGDAAMRLYGDEVVPEPTTLAIFGIGALCASGVGMRRRRRK
jgi:hypothetical protein